MRTHYKDEMKELFDFIVGAKVVSDDTGKVSLEGKVAAFTFEKDGVKKSIGFCGNDCGSWLQEFSLTPTEYTSFEEWELSILNLYYTGRFIDSRTFDHNGSMHLFKGSFPDMFANLEEADLKKNVEDYILRDRDEEYVMPEPYDDKPYLELADKVSAMFSECYSKLEKAFEEAVISDDISGDFGSFVVTIPSRDDVTLPEGFTLDSVTNKSILKVSHKELRDLNSKFQTGPLGFKI